MPGSPIRLVAVAALVVAALLAAVALFGDAADAGEAPVPFVWADVAAVYLACAFPLAGWLAAGLVRRAPGAVSVGVGAAVLVTSVAVLLVGAPGSGPVERAGLALGLAFAVAVPVCVLLNTRGTGLWPVQSPHRPEACATDFKVVFAALGVAAWLLPPHTYVASRVRHDTARLGELAGESRIGEARALARNLTLLAPDATWNGRPLPDVVAGLDRTATDLERRAELPLPGSATADQRIARGRILAMLGRTADALAVLAPVTASPEADALRGAVHEARGEWDAGLQAFDHARSAWDREPPSAGRDAGLVRATTGVAFCQRKLGRYAAADAAYRELLALNPTADTHFLLARFYDDAQQAGAARDHARRAAALDPARYGREADRLVRKLSVYQFGCLGVFAGGAEPGP